MKHNYSRLCLKQRWGLFAICIILAIIFATFAFYTGITNMATWKTLCGILLSIAFIGLSTCLFCLNIRRKRIQYEFLYEMDKEVRAREHICPKCGAKIGVSNACLKCGYKAH